MANKSPRHRYENNPFFIASNGITLLANLASGVFILYLVVSLFTLLTDSFTPYPGEISVNHFVTAVNGWTPSDWVLITGSGFIIGLAFALVFALFGGVSAYTSARLALGQRVSLGTAFREAFERLWSFLWLQIIIVVKVLLWSLLFIIPGVIMAVRYSLAGVAFFDERKNLRGNAAVKESLRLTKGAWITTYASHTLFNLLSLGAISSIVSMSVNATLYQQFDQSKAKKPEAHWLSWVTLVLPFAILMVLVVFTVAIAAIASLISATTS